MKRGATRIQTHRRLICVCRDTMAAKIYWAINWLGVFCNCNHIPLLYIVLCVWAVFFVPAFSCSRPESFLPEYIFPCRHNTTFRFFTREECFYAASSSALWTTTIVSLFSTHLNKCDALYIEIYSCGNKPNEKDAMWMPSRQQMSHSARRLPFEKSVHVVERAAIKQSSRKLLSNSIALAWIQIFRPPRRDFTSHTCSLPAHPFQFSHSSQFIRFQNRAQKSVPV
jgi:hypothetical protein